MKNKIFSQLLLFFFPMALFAQSSQVFDYLTITSKILKSERKYAVYLPAGYETSQRSYPVLYLLHGATDNHTGWIQFGEVQRIADEAIKNGTATAMIIVMPDADTGRMGYFNAIGGDWNYENFFFSEFVPTIEKTFRIKSEKRYRAIAGLSMGGGGSFVYALHHPELFSSACPLSAYAGPLNMQEAISRLSKSDPNVTDTTLIKNYYKKYSPVELVNSGADDQLKGVKWYIDCGDDDFLYEGNSLIHIAMRKKNIPHEYRVRDGAHNWTYWRAALPDVLEFVSDTFHQK